jgi:hypothetical protein
MKTEPTLFKYINLPVEEGVHRAWRQECVASRRTLAQVLEQAITRYVTAEAAKREAVHAGEEAP